MSLKWSGNLGVSWGGCHACRARLRDGTTRTMHRRTVALGDVGGDVGARWLVSARGEGRVSTAGMPGPPIYRHMACAVAALVGLLDHPSSAGRAPYRGQDGRSRAQVPERAGTTWRATFPHLHLTVACVARYAGDSMPARMRGLPDPRSACSMWHLTPARWASRRGHGCRTPNRRARCGTTGR